MNPVDMNFTAYLIIDLRSTALRQRAPLSQQWRQRAVSLEQIEAGTHGLSAADGPLLVVCERGVRSALAAQFLRADGLDVQHLPGGLTALPTVDLG